MTRERSHDFCQTRLLTRGVVFSICTSVLTPEDAKSLFLCNTLWVGQKERGRLQLNIASLSIHGSVTVPRQEPLDTDNDCAVCNDNPAETTSDPAQFRLQFYSEI